MSSSKVVDITSESQYNSILEKNDNVVINLTAGWCNPCKAISPVYSSLATELYEAKNKAVLARIDCSDGIPDFCETDSGIPRFRFYYKGKEQPHKLIKGGSAESIVKLSKAIRAL